MFQFCYELYTKLLTVCFFMGEEPQKEDYTSFRALGTDEPKFDNAVTSRGHPMLEKMCHSPLI